MTPTDIAEKEGRIKFFPNGSYKYTPSAKAQKQIENFKKPFDSEKAHLKYELKISKRKKVLQEVDRRLAKIEKYVDKGLIKISNKQFICQK